VRSLGFSIGVCGWRWRVLPEGFVFSGEAAHGFNAPPAQVVPENVELPAGVAEAAWFNVGHERPHRES